MSGIPGIGETYEEAPQACENASRDVTWFISGDKLVIDLTSDESPKGVRDVELRFKDGVLASQIVENRQSRGN